MARRSASRARRIDPLITFDALSIEGAILQPEMIARIAAREAGEQEEVAYGLDPKEKLRDVVQTKFPLAQSLLARLAGSDRGPQALQRFLQNLFAQVFEFTDLERTRPVETTGRSFPIGHQALGGRVPIVFAPHGKIDASSKAFSDGGRARSPSQMLQEYLNVKNRALWGLICDGVRLRLYRDNAALTRPAYLEADLERILDADTPLMADFSVLWMVIHASRFGSADTPVTDCVLERWRDAGRKQGIIARERLRDGVEKALLEFGQGFLEHPANDALRADLHEGRLSPQSYLEALLRLIYRFLFVFTAEDRDLLHLPSPEEPDAARAHARAKAIYARGYSLARLRERSVKQHARDRYGDGWEGVTILFRALWRGEAALTLPALGGLFANVGGPRSFEDCSLSNARLYEAIFRLAWLRTEAGLERVNWRDMETEELGSVYESLLELTPKLGGPEGFSFIGAGGNARKTTASYYTPDSLVQALLDEALDPLIEETVEGKEGQAAIEALLGLKIIDPACGSGHFLLAAGRRVAARCAQLASPGAPSASDYRHWLREAARRCLFGVDKNPLAVELAKVALWIETVEPGKPLSFFDAHIRCGDSLLGIYDLDALQKGIPDGAYKPLTGDVKAAASEWRKRNKAEREARAQGELGLIGPPRALMEAARRLEAQEEDDLSAVEAKAKAFQAFLAGEDRHRLETACDIYIAAFLLPKTNPPARLSGDGGAYLPTTRDVWEMLAGQQPHGLLIGNAVDAARAAGAFHWPLEFPQVLANGGFDLALGNPPWERVKLQEKEFFAARDEEIANAPNKAARQRLIDALATAPEGSAERRLHELFFRSKREAEATSIFVRTPGEAGGRFPLTGTGDVNTYALFTELFASVARNAGVIVPTGIATDATTAPFFANLVDRKRLAALIDFENRERLFTDVYFRVRFCLLALREHEERTRFSCLLTQPTQIFDENRHFTLSPEEIIAINPNTRTAPMFRSRADADLSAKIYSRFPVLIDEKMGGESHETGNPWGVSFGTLFHMSGDSGLFRTASQLRDGGFERDGQIWIAESNDELYIPLVEAKMLHFYNHRHGDFSTAAEKDDADIRELPRAEGEILSNADYEPSPRYWVPKKEVDLRLSQKGWNRNWLAGWRDITNVSNERTVIPSTIPRSGVGHTVPLLFFDTEPRQWAVLCAILSSVTLDYIARQKVGGTHLTYGYLKQFPVPSPCYFAQAHMEFIVPRVLELTYTSYSMRPFAEDLEYEGSPFAWKEDRRAQLRAELDAYIADLYGLTRDHLRFVLDPTEVYGAEYPSETFRVLKEREIRTFGEYRTARLVLDAWDRLERGEVPEISPPITVETRPAAVVQQPVSIDPATLPDGAWARPAAGNQDVRAATLVQLAALMKALPGPTPIEQVRRAALYALEPRYLTRWLSGADRTTWLRLVGPEAVLASGASIAAFAPTIDAGWRDAVTQLRGMGAIIEDAAADTWAPGARVDEFYTETWPDGRAAFVLKALESMTPEEWEADLSTEDQQWVRADAG